MNSKPRFIFLLISLVAELASSLREYMRLVKRRLLASLVILCRLCLCFTSTSATLEDEKRLRNDLSLGYNRLVRPVEKNTDQLIVKFGIRLIQILDVVGVPASTRFRSAPF